MISGFAETALAKAVPAQNEVQYGLERSVLDFGCGRRGFAFGRHQTTGLLNQIASCRNSEAFQFSRLPAANNNYLKSLVHVFDWDSAIPRIDSKRIFL